MQEGSAKVAIKDVTFAGWRIKVKILIFVSNHCNQFQQVWDQNNDAENWYQTHSYVIYTFIFPHDLIQHKGLYWVLDEVMPPGGCWKMNVLYWKLGWKLPLTSVQMSAHMLRMQDLFFWLEKTWLPWRSFNCK